MKGKGLLSIWLSSMILAAGALSFAACGEEKPPEPIDNGGNEQISSSDLPATTSVIALETYRDKVKGGIAGSMAGVAYGYRDFVKSQKWEFSARTWIDERALPSWETKTISNGYDQDDIYLAMTAIEAFTDLGIDVTSKELGIYMYNKNFEFWDGSNSDVLARGFAPPYSGYPKQATGYYTNAFSDGNSYQCGASFGGYLGLNMTGAANEMVERVASICTYGDGIYATQYIAAMYGAAFFTSDIHSIIESGLAAIPEDSWSAEIIRDVLENKENGMTAQENYEAIMKKWVDYSGGKFNSEYQWIEWPSNLLLDAKVCSAFTTLGLLYGEGDLEKSTKITMQCANDCDSTAAATAGILSVITGWDELESQIKNGIIENQYFKYTRSTVDDITDQCVDLIQKIVTEQGGKVANVDGTLSLVIPESAKTAQIGEYKSGKTATKAELGDPVLYTEEEMARLRYISEPGFETCQSDGKAGGVSNGWTTSNSAKTTVECLEQTSYSGLANVKLTAKSGETITLSNVTNRELVKNTNYELTCMVRFSEGFASELKLAVWNTAGLVLRSQVCEVQDGWCQVTLTFNTGNNTALSVGVQLAGSNDADFVRLDDFELRLK